MHYILFKFFFAYTCIKKHLISYFFIVNIVNSQNTKKLRKSCIQNITNYFFLRSTQYF